MQPQSIYTAATVFSSPRLLSKPATPPVTTADFTSHPFIVHLGVFHSTVQYPKAAQSTHIKHQTASTKFFNSKVKCLKFTANSSSLICSNEYKHTFWFINVCTQEKHDYAKEKGRKKKKMSKKRTRTKRVCREYRYCRR